MRRIIFILIAYIFLPIVKMNLLTGMATTQFSDCSTSNDTAAELIEDRGFFGHLVTILNDNYIIATIVNIINTSRTRPKNFWLYDIYVSVKENNNYVINIKLMSDCDKS